jgi:hypothetical protein
MVKPKPVAPVKRVWRISERAPLGEWVDNVVPLPVPVPHLSKELPEVSYGSWVTSSYDLLDGADVTDDPDTLPGELFDELFAPKPEGPKSTPEG